MFSKRLAILVTLLLMACALTLAAQDDKPVVAPASASKFAQLKVLPACATISVQRGDPSKGPSSILLKAASGCKIPWHWHTAAEHIVFISGSGKMQMKDDAQPSAVKPGDYVFLPGKHTHEFTCTANCLLFDMPEGAFDIHYVDKEGTEIPMEQALKKPAKAAKK
jgi:quercetin dioxygenase-like cupin family protein